MTRTTTSTRFSQLQVVHAREPASFWRENVVAVVILQRDIARIGRGGGNKLSNVRSFYHFAIGRGLNFLQYGNNRTNFFGKRKGKMKLSGVSFFWRTRAKTLS